MIWLLPVEFLGVLDLFRLLEVLQIGALVQQLWWLGLDAGCSGGGGLWTAARFVVLAVRGLHALHSVFTHLSFAKRQNPALDFVSFCKEELLLLRSAKTDGGATRRERTIQLVPLQRELLAILQHVSVIKEEDEEKEIETDNLLPAVAFLMFSNIMCNTHNLYDPRLAGPLTMFQAVDSITIFLKSFVLDRLLSNMRHRALVFFLFFVSLAIQWPIMPSMFFGAVYPVMHIGAEIALALSAYERYQRSTF